MAKKCIAETYHSEIWLYSNDTGSVTKKFRHKDDPQSLARFRQEVHALNRVGAHPNLNQLLTSSEADLSITLTLAPGHVLTSYDSNLLLIYSHQIYKQLISALVHIHSCGMVHDDVKPMNIVLFIGHGPEEAVITLVDFGACIERGRFTSSGTPWYMAPEYIQRIKDTKTDVWALGITMAWVTGQISLPEKRSDEWILPHIWTNEEDMQKMEGRLRIVKTLQERLSTSRGLAKLVALSLESDHDKRIGCDGLATLLEQEAR